MLCILPCAMLPANLLEFNANKVRCYSFNTVTCRPISRQRSKYAHATIQKVLQELFPMWSEPWPLLGNEELNTFPQKQVRGIIWGLLLGTGAVNRLCQEYRLCFPWSSWKVDIRESSSEADSQLLWKNENGNWRSVLMIGEVGRLAIAL
jgi:hypothetical protein